MNADGRALKNFMLEFYKQFPQYRPLTLFLEGVSYGGRYMPAFAYAIHKEHNKDKKLRAGVDEEYINLGGVIVNNGLTDG